MHYVSPAAIALLYPVIIIECFNDGLVSGYIVAVDKALDMIKDYHALRLHDLRRLPIHE